MVPFDDAAGGGHAGGGARAGEVFAWAPRAAGLNGGLFVADAIHFADYDVIEQPPDGTFSEIGYLPITGFSLGGEPVEAEGLNDPDGGGWGAYMRIEGSGTTGLSPSGTPASDYDVLDYEIVGFDGFATYGFDAEGDVAVEGEINDPVTLLAGSLIDARVDFVPSDGGFTIEGTVSLTVEEVAPLFAAGRLDVLDLTILHPPEDYSFTPPTTVRVAATSGTDGSFAAAASAEAADPAVLEEPVDWDAVAARVTQNFLETGQWYH